MEKGLKPAEYLFEPENLIPCLLLCDDDLICTVFIINRCNKRSRTSNPESLRYAAVKIKALIQVGFEAFKIYCTGQFVFLLQR
jgi:hypothetical protein